MIEQLVQLVRLRAELHAINEEFAKAARPLERLSEMNEEQRQKVADELRARLARWESVSHEISQVFGANRTTVVPEAETKGLTR